MAKHSSWTVKVVLRSLRGLLMLFYLGDVHAQSPSGSDLYTTRKVSISYQHVYLDEVLQKLSEQAGVYFVYSGHVLEPRVPAVSITANQQPLWHVLQTLGQQLHLTFRTEGKYIIVKKAAAVKTVALAPAARLLLHPLFPMSAPHPPLLLPENRFHFSRLYDPTLCPLRLPATGNRHCFRLPTVQPDGSLPDGLYRAVFCERYHLRWP